MARRPASDGQVVRHLGPPRVAGSPSAPRIAKPDDLSRRQPRGSAACAHAHAPRALPNERTTAPRGRLGPACAAPPPTPRGARERATGPPPLVGAHAPLLGDAPCRGRSVGSTGSQPATRRERSAAHDGTTHAAARAPLHRASQQDRRRNRTARARARARARRAPATPLPSDCARAHRTVRAARPPALPQRSATSSP